MSIKLLFTLVFFSFTFFLYAQKPIHYSFNANVGISSLAQNNKGVVLIADRYNHQALLSYDFGIGIEFKLSDQMNFATGLSYVNLKGEDIYTSFIPTTFTSAATIEVSQRIRFNINKIAIPYQFIIEVKKFSFGIGGQSQVFINGKTNERLNIVNEEDRTVAELAGLRESSIVNSIRSLFRIDSGLFTNLAYDLNEKLAIQSSFFYGFNTKNNYFFLFGKVRQATLGVKYSL